ncbi:MAG: hypothetical protein U5J83_01805 [Bryobacterales bacterium]|nr:hypothetical protein [Bryobacterales bacterium]
MLTSMIRTYAVVTGELVDHRLHLFTDAGKRTLLRLVELQLGVFAGALQIALLIVDILAQLTQSFLRSGINAALQLLLQLLDLALLILKQLLLGIKPLLQSLSTAVWPSLVLMMACWMLMMPTLVGAVCACRAKARPNTRRLRITIFCFTLLCPGAAPSGNGRPPENFKRTATALRRYG